MVERARDPAEDTMLTRALTGRAARAVATAHAEGRLPHRGRLRRNSVQRASRLMKEAGAAGGDHRMQPLGGAVGGDGDGSLQGIVGEIWRQAQELGCRNVAMDAC